ncbi:hypothetical protein KIW84_045605 [Lathyrus oleraceus]|uniref:Uncharacterized protein n=1 Tax=Pisum sativum TaxID=3888 RepID=A0A9D4XKU2_PEA|nr:hypothetical protein KIW84_045605 [Pisum sativum]
MMQSFHKDETCASLLIRSLALELNLQKDMLAGASHLYAHKLECFPHGIDSFPQPLGLIKKRYDDSDKDIKPCHHLDDPHHKVAQAALSTLADIVPACRKPFEGYMERMLPHVFSRKTYSINSLLPALLQALDEQRSPKAKLAVIEFAINSFDEHTMNAEGAANIGILNCGLLS